uniref:Putative isopenicillin-n-synthase n=1 Tax=Ctenophora sp. W WRF-2014 TaxID=1567053 RepID=A0A0A0RVU9_9METZ|nr:putative isopenicillin-n-synthase [Ctenophora sp. W WRF-2014]
MVLMSAPDGPYNGNFNPLSNVPSNPLSNVPKFNYQDILDGSAREDIIQAMQQYAFFYIINIPGFDAHAEVEAIKAFFSLPQAVKERCASIKHNANNTNILRGYGFTKSTTGQPIEEVFNMGQYEERKITLSDVESNAEFISREPNKWPGDEDFSASKEFRSALQSGFEMRMRLGRRLVEEIGRGLDYTQFGEKFTESEFTSFYLKKYTAREEKDNVNIYKADSGYSMKAEDGRDLSIPSHVDTTITLLTTYANGGLQALYKGEWYDVPSVMGSIMLMSGSLIEELSDGKLPSLRHRVIDIKSDRYSTPFFFNPSYHAKICESLSGKRTETGKEWVTFGPWQVKQLHRDEPLLLTPTSLN